MLVPVPVPVLVPDPLPLLVTTVQVAGGDVCQTHTLREGENTVPLGHENTYKIPFAQRWNFVQSLDHGVRSSAEVQAFFFQFNIQSLDRHVKMAV